MVPDIGRDNWKDDVATTREYDSSALRDGFTGRVLSAESNGATPRERRRVIQIIPSGRVRWSPKGRDRAGSVHPSDLELKAA